MSITFLDVLPWYLLIWIVISLFLRFTGDRNKMSIGLYIALLMTWPFLIVLFLLDWILRKEL